MPRPDQHNKELQEFHREESFQPEAQYISQMDRQRLLQLLRESFCRLSDLERKLLYKRFYQNKKLHEIAGELSSPDEGNAKGSFGCKDITTISKQIKRTLGKLEHYFHKQNIYSIKDLLS